MDEMIFAFIYSKHTFVYFSYESTFVTHSLNRNKYAVKAVQVYLIENFLFMTLKGNNNLFQSVEYCAQRCGV
jgi:hypothetical protein